MATILLISNGHGEDTVGAGIAVKLQHRSERVSTGLNVVAMPIVGLGAPYREKGIKVTGPRQDMPSGGLVYLHPENLAKDVKAGLFRLAWEQIRFLKEIRDKVDLAIGVGDKVILLAQAFVLRKPMIFVGVADSSYYTGGKKPVFTRRIRRIMRKHCRKVFARDAESARSLRENGVSQAVFAGNPIMDTIEITGDDLGLGDEYFKIGILPGSRADAYDNFGLIMNVCRRAAERYNGDLALLVAVAPHIIKEDLARRMGEPVPFPVVLTDKFGDVLDQAQLVIGLAGTGNEQAAGMGKPVVIFPGVGTQITEYFTLSQKRLLGEALLVVSREPEEAAAEILALINDPGRRQRMGAAGAERLGGFGAAAAVADAALAFLQGRG